jgi:hypothetical protein
MIIQLRKLNEATSSQANNTLSFISRVRHGIWEAMDLIQRRHNFSTHHLPKMIIKGTLTSSCFRMQEDWPLFKKQINPKERRAMCSGIKMGKGNNISQV